MEYQLLAQYGGNNEIKVCVMMIEMMEMMDDHLLDLS
jgi:hypothetical protein